MIVQDVSGVLCSFFSVFLFFFSYHQSISQSAPPFHTSRRLPGASYKRSCQRVRIKPVRKCDCSSSWTRPEEVKLVRLMPAAAIVCFSFPNGRIIPVCRCKKGLCQESRRKAVSLLSLSFSFFSSNFDVPIIVDFLLLGWLLRWILSVSRRV